MEVESKLTFLDIPLHIDGHNIIKTVYRKMINNDAYLNWYPFCPREWKQEKHFFVIKNNFLLWVVKKIREEEKETIDNKNNANENKHTVQKNAKLESKSKSRLFLLPYQGEKGFHLTRSLKRKLKSLFCTARVKQILALQVKSQDTYIN